MSAFFRGWLGALALLLISPGKAHAERASSFSFAAALHAARPGDTLRLPPGEFFECGIVLKDGLVIEGAGAEATVLSDRVCEGKAVLVIRARGVVVRDLTLARARTQEDNGAGIRAEGEDLLLERLHFENNQIGVLTGGFRGRLEVRQSRFLRHGLAGSQRPSAAIMVNSAALLRLEDTEVRDSRGGAAVISGASLTEVRGGVFLRAAAPRGATVQVSGALRLEGATLQASLHPTGREVAVLALPGAAPLVLRDIRMEGPGVLLLNWAGTTPELAGNWLAPGAVEMSSAGAWRHQLVVAAREAKVAIRHLAGAAKRQAVEWFRHY